MVKDTLLVILCGFLWQPVLTNAADFVLVDEKAGIAPAPLVLSPDAPPRTRDAAIELADHIEKICGARPKLIEGASEHPPKRHLGGLPTSARFSVSQGRLRLEATRGNPHHGNESHLAIAGRDRWDPEHLDVEGIDGRIVGKQQEYGTVNAVYTFLQDYLGVGLL